MIIKTLNRSERIRFSELVTPSEAKLTGRHVKLREDWEEFKDNVMRKAVYAKFSQNIELKNILLDTDSEYIVENTSNDYYWGCGINGSGKNMLGIILMEIRDKLKLL